MDCFYQGSRLRESAYYNSPPLIYGYGMPTYCSRQFFSPISRNSEINTSRRNTGSRGASPSSQNVPNLMTISESNSSPASTASHTPPESPTECTTETHQSTSKEASEDSGNSVKDTSESEEKTGTKWKYFIDLSLLNKKKICYVVIPHTRLKTIVGVTSKCFEPCLRVWALQLPLRHFK